MSIVGKKCDSNSNYWLYELVKLPYRLEPVVMSTTRRGILVDAGTNHPAATGDAGWKGKFE